MGTGSLPGVKSGRGVTLTPQPILVPWSRKSRAIPLLPLWAVRPVQSLSDCTRVHFTLPKNKLKSTQIIRHNAAWFRSSWILCCTDWYSFRSFGLKPMKRHGATSQKTGIFKMRPKVSFVCSRNVIFFNSKVHYKNLKSVQHESS